MRVNRRSNISRERHAERKSCTCARPEVEIDGQLKATVSLRNSTRVRKRRKAK